MKERKVFLGGTCNNSKWREELIPNLTINYFNPVVDEWTPEFQEEEIKQKKICEYQLYVLTPKMKGVFSIAEVVDSSNKNPNNTILCILNEYEGERFEDFQLKSLDALKRLVKSNGAFVTNNLKNVYKYLNTMASKNAIEEIQYLINLETSNDFVGDLNDGYHSFNELYEYRKLYNAAFFNELVKNNVCKVHKSKKHSDGEECFGGGWFIVMADLPTGQISNHYELKDWDLFICPEQEYADKWDGHNPKDVINRLKEYIK